MSPELKRVARAIGAELIRQELAGEDLSETESNEHLARAALQAIRSATPGMLNAGMTKADHTLAAEWTAMVDHILGEEPNA